MSDNEYAAPDPARPGPAAADEPEAASVGGPGSVPFTNGAPLEADLDAMQREQSELLDTLRRLQADFENYRKRVLREQTQLVERATQGLLEQLLPVLDSFGLAVANLEADDVDVEKLRKGIELVYSELFAVLAKAGLEPMPADGAPFDPTLHEAVMQEPGDGEPIVVEVLRPGWMQSGRVLRPAMVKVGHSPAAGAHDRAQNL